MRSFTRRDFLQRCAAVGIATRGMRARAATALSRALAMNDPKKLTDVNSTSLRAGIELGCQAVSRLFNPDDPEGAPYFWMNLRPVASMSFSDVFSDAQVPGKSLLGLLTAEKLVGLEASPAVVDQYARIAFFSYGGPVALPLNRSALGGRLVNFAPVNVAHGFHALYALATLRRSDRAHALFEKGVDAVLALWDPRSGWNRQRIQDDLGLSYHDVQPDAPFIAGLAMAIGPLAKYHAATGSRRALELATMLKDKVLTEYFPASGEYDAARLGAHVQNVVYVMASLAWLATATHDASLMARVKAFYDNGLKRLRNSIGWSPEYFGNPSHARGPRGTNGERGEAGNTALILETALLLGDWGHFETFADAELILRGHLLPSQLRDVSFVAGVDRPAARGSLSIGRRVQGMWGFPAPYGHLPIGDEIIGVGTDIVGPVVYALAEAHARVIGRRNGQLAINLLFDYKSDDIEVTSPYPGGILTVALRSPQPVEVRIPPWASGDRLELIGISRDSATLSDGYLQVAAGAARDGRFGIRIPLTQRELDVSTGSRLLRTRVKGDQVIAMDNPVADGTFFDPYTS